MSFKTAAAALALLLTAGVANAQTTQQKAPAAPAAPAAAAPAAPAKAATPAATPAKAEPKVNVNTANADELDKLPQIGPARSKAILENRVAAKGGAYKDMADLEKRANLPSNAIDAIKDKVRFR